MRSDAPSFTHRAEFAPGKVAFEPPGKPLRIAVPLRVPRFGDVFL
jgi:hypothetical protein